MKGNSMNRRNALIAAVTMSLATFAIAVPDARAQGSSPPSSGGISVPLLDTETADVVLTVQQFTRSGSQILAQGIVTASVIDAATGTVRTVTQQVSIPLLLTGASTGTCELLHLVLGPLDLNLLGLQVNLSEVVLDIVAESGAGNLLGNLLCAVAGLLDPNSALAPLFAGVVLHPRSSIGVRRGGVSCACAIVNVTQVLHQASKE